MMATGSHQTIPLATRANRAPSTTTLSASGSRKAPDRVVPCLRASHPSMPSDRASRPPKTKVNQLAPHSMIRAMTTGVANRRSTVIPLAGVSRAEGPKVLARATDAPGTGASGCEGAVAHRAAPDTAGGHGRSRLTGPPGSTRSATRSGPSAPVTTTSTKRSHRKIVGQGSRSRRSPGPPGRCDPRPVRPPAPRRWSR